MLKAKLYLVCHFIFLLISINPIHNYTLNSHLNHDNTQQQVYLSDIQSLKSIQKPPQTPDIVTLQTKQQIKLNNLILFHEFNQLLIKSEIYQIRGRLNKQAGQFGALINLSMKNKQNFNLAYKFQLFLNQGQKYFNFKINTQNIKQADYSVLIYVCSKQEGCSNRNATLIDCKILSQKIQTQRIALIEAPLLQSELKIEVIKNKLVLNWREDNKTSLDKLIFSQPGIKPIQYILTNFQSSFQVLNEDFQYFRLGQNIMVSLSSAYSQSYSLLGRLSSYSPSLEIVFKVGQHIFDRPTLGINLTSHIPWKIAVGSSLLIEGTALIPLVNTIFTIEPQFAIGNYSLVDNGPSQLVKNTKFYKTLTLNKQGVYIIQINSISGYSLLSIPVYVGQAYPLLPDYFDLYPSTISLNQVPHQYSMKQQRNILLKLINKKRLQWGISDLQMDQKLNILAQNHSKDMISRRFYSHVNPDGKGIQDRAKKLGIEQAVAQNIASDQNIVRVHEQLSRSPAHLLNIVNPNFKIIGLGIAADQSGFVYVTQNFAAGNEKQN